MREVLKELTAEQIGFIWSECSVDEKELFEMSEDDLYDKVYDILCDIECEETPSNGEELSERGSMASDLVTLLGNTIITDD